MSAPRFHCPACGDAEPCSNPMCENFVFPGKGPFVAFADFLSLRIMPQYRIDSRTLWPDTFYTYNHGAPIMNIDTVEALASGDFWILTTTPRQTQARISAHAGYATQASATIIKDEDDANEAAKTWFDASGQTHDVFLAHVTREGTEVFQVERPKVSLVRWTPKELEATVVDSGS